MIGLTRLDLMAIGAREMAKSTKFNPQQVYVAGSDANIICASASYMALAVARQSIDSFGNFLLGSASNENLDRLAWDWLQLVRPGASAARGQVQIYRTSAALGGGDVLTGTQVLTNDNIAYTTTQTASFGGSDLSATVNARAVQAGSAFQVGANAIQRFADPSALFDPTLQVTNPAQMSGGGDRMQDPEFREYIRGYRSSLQRGTLSAIEFGATTIPGIVSASAIEATTQVGAPARVVQLTFADGSGGANAALAAEVTDGGLDEYRCAGIQVIALLGTPQMTSVALHLAFGANVDTATIGELVRISIFNYVNSLAVNETLTLSALSAQLLRFATLGLIVNQSTIVSPVGDVVPTLGSSLRTTLNAVTLV